MIGLGGHYIFDIVLIERIIHVYKRTIGLNVLGGFNFVAVFLQFLKICGFLDSVVEIFHLLRLFYIKIDNILLIYVLNLLYTLDASDRLVKNCVRLLQTFKVQYSSHHNNNGNWGNDRSYYDGHSVSVVERKKTLLFFFFRNITKISLKSSCLA